MTRKSDIQLKISSPSLAYVFISDVIVLLLLLSCWITTCRSSIGDDDKILIPSIMALSYYVLRILGKNKNDVFHGLCYAVICVLCLFEVMTGYLQFFRIIPSKNTLDAMTGSFMSSGSFGGFLAVLLSIMTAFIFNNRNDTSSKLRRFTQNISLIILCLGIALLPAIRSRSAIISYVVAVAFMVLKKEEVRLFLRKYLILIISLSLIAMTLLFMVKRPSAEGRFYMDYISLRIMKSNSFHGSGFGSYGALYGKEQSRFFLENTNKGSEAFDLIERNDEIRKIADCPDRAFNDYLQIGVEFGLIEMLLYVLVLVVGIIHSHKHNSIWGYGLISYSFFSLFYYPLLLTQFQILLPIILACSVSLEKQRGRNMVVILIPICICAYLICCNYQHFILRTKAEKCWEEGDRWHTPEYSDFVIRECKKNFDLLKNNPDFLFTYGKVLNSKGEYHLSDSILLMGTEVSGDPMFWNIMGRNSASMNKYDEAESRFLHAFSIVPNRLYPLCLLAKLYHEKGDTLSFLNLTERIKVFVPKVESVMTKDLRSEIAEIEAEYINEKYDE